MVLTLTFTYPDNFIDAHSLVGVPLIWVAVALNLAAPIWLIVTSANMANLGAIVTFPTLLYLNRNPPKELRMSWPIEVIEIVFMIFCMYFFFSVIGAMAGIL